MPSGISSVSSDFHYPNSLLFLHFTSYLSFLRRNAEPLHGFGRQHQGLSNFGQNSLISSSEAKRFFSSDPRESAEELDDDVFIRDEPPTERWGERQRRLPHDELTVTDIQDVTNFCGRLVPTHEFLQAFPKLNEQIARELEKVGGLSAEEYATSSEATELATALKFMLSLMTNQMFRDGPLFRRARGDINEFFGLLSDYLALQNSRRVLVDFRILYRVALLLQNARTHKLLGANHRPLRPQFSTAQNNFFKAYHEYLDGGVPGQDASKFADPDVTFLYVLKLASASFDEYSGRSAALGHVLRRLDAEHGAQVDKAKARRQERQDSGLQEADQELYEEQTRALSEREERERSDEAKWLAVLLSKATRTDELAIRGTELAVKLSDYLTSPAVIDSLTIREHVMIFLANLRGVQVSQGFQQAQLYQSLQKNLDFISQNVDLLQEGNVRQLVSALPSFMSIVQHYRGSSTPELFRAAHGKALQMYGELVNLVCEMAIQNSELVNTQFIINFTSNFQNLRDLGIDPTLAGRVRPRLEQMNALWDIIFAKLKFDQDERGQRSFSKFSQPHLEGVVLLHRQVRTQGSQQALADLLVEEHMIPILEEHLTGQRAKLLSSLHTSVREHLLREVSDSDLEAQRFARLLEIENKIARQLVAQFEIERTGRRGRALPTYLDQMIFVDRLRSSDEALPDSTSERSKATLAETSALLTEFRNEIANKAEQQRAWLPREDLVTVLDSYYQAPRLARQTRDVIAKIANDQLIVPLGTRYDPLLATDIFLRAVNRRKRSITGEATLGQEGEEEMAVSEAEQSEAEVEVEGESASVEVAEGESKEIDQNADAIADIDSPRFFGEFVTNAILNALRSQPGKIDFVLKKLSLELYKPLSTHTPGKQRFVLTTLTPVFRDEEFMSRLRVFQQRQIYLTCHALIGDHLDTLNKSLQGLNKTDPTVSASTGRSLRAILELADALKGAAPTAATLIPQTRELYNKLQALRRFDVQRNETAFQARIIEIYKEKIDYWLNNLDSTRLEDRNNARHARNAIDLIENLMGYGVTPETKRAADELYKLVDAKKILKQLDNDRLSMGAVRQQVRVLRDFRDKSALISRTVSQEKRAAEADSDSASQAGSDVEELGDAEMTPTEEAYQGIEQLTGADLSELAGILVKKLSKVNGDKESIDERIESDRGEISASVSRQISDNRRDAALLLKTLIDASFVPEHLFKREAGTIGGKRGDMGALTRGIYRILGPKTVFSVLSEEAKPWYPPGARGASRRFFQNFAGVFDASQLADSLDVETVIKYAGACRRHEVLMAKPYNDCIKILWEKWNDPALTPALLGDFAEVLSENGMKQIDIFAQTWAKIQAEADKVEEGPQNSSGSDGCGRSIAQIFSAAINLGLEDEPFVEEILNSNEIIQKISSKDSFEQLLESRGFRTQVKVLSAILTADLHNKKPEIYEPLVTSLLKSINGAGQIPTSKPGLTRAVGPQLYSIRSLIEKPTTEFEKGLASLLDEENLKALKQNGDPREAVMRQRPSRWSGGGVPAGLARETEIFDILKKMGYDDIQEGVVKNGVFLQAYSEEKNTYFQCMCTLDKLMYDKVSERPLVNFNEKIVSAAFGDSPPSMHRVNLYELEKEPTESRQKFLTEKCGIKDFSPVQDNEPETETEKATEETSSTQNA